MRLVVKVDNAGLALQEPPGLAALDAIENHLTRQSHIAEATAIVLDPHVDTEVGNIGAMAAAGKPAGDDVILRYPKENIFEVDLSGSVAFLDALEVLAEALLARAPMSNRIIVGFLRLFEACRHPVPVNVPVALQAHTFVIELANGGVEDELRETAAVPDPASLLGSHVIGNAMFRLAGRKALVERRASVLKALEHRPVKLRLVRHRHLGDIGGAMSAGETFSRVLQLDQLALRRRAHLVHIKAACHGREVRVLAAGVGVHLGVEHQDHNIRPVLDYDLRDVLEADITHAAIAADRPHLGQLLHLEVRHDRIGEVAIIKIVALFELLVSEKTVGKALRNNRVPGVVEDKALAKEPADRRSILKERVHPGIRMRVVWRGRAIDRIAAGVGAHRHDRHAVGEAAVHRLKLPMVKRLLAQHRDDRVDELLVGNLSVFFQAGLGVCV